MTRQVSPKGHVKEAVGPTVGHDSDGPAFDVLMVISPGSELPAPAPGSALTVKYTSRRVGRRRPRSSRTAVRRRRWRWRVARRTVSHPGFLSIRSVYRLVARLRSNTIKKGNRDPAGAVPFTISITVGRATYANRTERLCLRRSARYTYALRRGLAPPAVNIIFTYSFCRLDQLHATRSYSIMYSG